MEKTVIGVGLDGKDVRVILKALVNFGDMLTVQNNDLESMKKDNENLRRDLQYANDKFDREHESLLEADRTIRCFEQDKSYCMGQIDRLREALEAARKENQKSLFARLDSSPEIQKVIQRCLQEKRTREDGSYSKIQAIKEIREIGGGYQCGCGLKEVKDYVEARLY